MSSVRRSSRLHTRVTLNLRHTDHEHSNTRSTYTRRTTPTIGTFKPISDVSPRTSGSKKRIFANEPLNSKQRPRPRYYRSPPLEAYLIIRAHRRPAGGWEEDWNKKGDGWYVVSCRVSHGHDRLIVDEIGHSIYQFYLE
jgi:hypothetical protein